MQKIAWLTDIHLNFLKTPDLKKFLRTLHESEADAFFISGDIGESYSVIHFLRLIEESVQRPVYFVMGNHDYYHSSVERVRQAVEDFTAGSQYLVWMNNAEIIELNRETALIGHDGWADGRYGNYEASWLILNDFGYIRELHRPMQEERLAAMQELADAAVDHIQTMLPLALDRYPCVYILTHVPPFSSVCRHRNHFAEDDFLPFYASKKMGDTLLKIASDYPQNTIKVLCGHTHTASEAYPRSNLHVSVGGSQYSHPSIQQIIELG